MTFLKNARNFCSSRDGGDKLKGNIISGSNFGMVLERKIFFLALKQTVPNCYGIDFDRFFVFYFARRFLVNHYAMKTCKKLLHKSAISIKPSKTLNSPYIVCVYAITKIPFGFQMVEC